MRTIRWILRHGLIGTLIAAVAILAIGLFTLRFGNDALYPPRPGEATVSVDIADHGVHAGIIVPVAALRDVAERSGDRRLSALAERYLAYSHVEIGWGDGQFYRFAPTLSDVTVVMAFNALSGLNDETVLHVVGLKAQGRTVFRKADVVTVNLSEAGFARLAEALSARFATDASGEIRELGQGLYGPSLFYAAKGHYSIANTCNRWISDLLHAAGLPSSPVPATLSVGLIAELRLRM